jgi:DNA mismatch repair protein MutS2
VKAGHLLDAKSAQAIGWGWLRDAIAPVSPYGERAFETIEPYQPGAEEAANARAQRVARIANAFDAERLDAAREIARHVSDAETAIARASMGDVLDDSNFLELQRFFDACERLDAFGVPCADVPRVVNEALRECAHALELGRAGRFGFYLDERFDVSLAQARAALAQAQAEYDAARGRATAAVASALGREISTPEFIVMRADLGSGALPAGVRVVREAPTYVLCEIDADERVLEALARRDGAAEALAQAEERVRERLSVIIRSHVAQLDNAMRAFGEADVLIAAARFARAHDCTPATIERESTIEFESGRFVPLEPELQAQGRAFTPIDLVLRGVAVLTGPNMGGKSVALRTCGFIALCAAYGLPVPARRARVALFAEIAWLGVGIDEDSGGLLSSFAREVVRLRDMFARTALPRLILLDEFARTTTPREGKALLVAVIERLRHEGACGLAATHLGAVAQAAGVRHFAVRGLRGIPEQPKTADLANALATLAASMDYTLEEVRDERSRSADAIALAALLGIERPIIDSAYRALELG